MSCEKHPQWVHDPADCPLCVDSPRPTRRVEPADLRTRLQQRARFLLEGLPHSTDFDDDRIINSSSCVAIAALLREAAAALPAPSGGFPVHQSREWQCRYVFSDQRCCGLPIDHDGEHKPAELPAPPGAPSPQPCASCGHDGSFHVDGRDCAAYSRLTGELCPCKSFAPPGAPRETKDDDLGSLGSSARAIPGDAAPRRRTKP